MRLRKWVDFPRAAWISLFLAVAVIAAVWLPEFAHWHVRPAPTATSAIETARNAPDQATLNELATMHLAAVVVGPSATVSAAEQIMRGTLTLPGFESTPIAIPFSPADLVRGLPTRQLAIASLVSADVLLDAYQLTRREEFLLQARDVILAFARFESAQWIDHGAVWNDHAISGRVPVLVKFWAEYRTRQDFDPAIGQAVLDLVSRSAELLAKPSFYAWSNSHGVVTDLALLQITAAFPWLPRAAEFRAIATGRFRDHLTYWIDEEGVTLLHSAGYHAGSLYHFGLALRLHSLNGVKISDAWWSRYEQAANFYASLRRPDGTLPMYGDTGSLPNEAGPLLTARRESDGSAEPLRERALPPSGEMFAIYPVAGHSIWWDGIAQPGASKSAAAQTVVTWSNHPGLGHKVADEASTIIWAAGRTWLTNTGYWPYGVPGRVAAESWESSNAPHLVGESSDSSRISGVRGEGHGSGIAFIDIERRGPSGYTVRRQVTRLVEGQVWIVVDHSTAPSGQDTTTNWTFYPDLSLTPTSTIGTYRVASPGEAQEMLSSFSGSSGFTSKVTSGSMAPFAGWVVLDRTPTRASAVVTNHPADTGWSLATFSLFDAGSPGTGRSARMEKWDDADHWTAIVPTAIGDLTLSRAGSRLALHREGASADTAVDVDAPRASEAGIRAVREAVLQAATTYRKFPEVISYRFKVSRMLLAAFAVQELLLFLSRRRFPRGARVLRIASWIAWIGGGIWLSQVYFSDQL